MELRRTMLFIPGNSPAMLQSGGLFGADAVILDLEDTVAPGEKDAARQLVVQALHHVDYSGSERVVRINPLDTVGAADIASVVSGRPDALLVPKVESAADILQAAALVEAAEAPGQGPVKLVALLETPRGLAAAGVIAEAHPRLTALALGAEDYTAALGAVRTKEGREIYTARTLVVNAAAAAGIQSFDTPFTDAGDEEGLLADTRLARMLGFKGKLAVHPRQIEPIHSVFNPTAGEIAWAERVLDALRQAEEEGSGIASLGGKMVDAPVAQRARQVLQLARRLGLATS